MLIHPRTLALVCAFVLSGHALAQNPGHPLRCGTPAAPPGLGIDGLSTPAGIDGPQDCGLGSTTPSVSYSATSVFLIPVVFHVITDGNGQGHVSAAQVRSQIDILNEDFRAKKGTGVDSMIEFALATTAPNGRSTNGITYTSNATWFQDSGQYYNNLAWDPHRYLNIYTNNGGGTLGYVPSLPQAGLVGQKSDRIVLRWDTVGRNASYGPPFHLGRTATHEVGHYLGLWHTFERSCGNSTCYSSGDTLCDTNTESAPHWGCTPSSSCSTADPIHNYMNYTDDQCMWEFTEEQSRRMRCTLEFWRPTVWTRCAAASVRNRHGGVNSNSYGCTPPVLGESSLCWVVPVTGHTASVVLGSSAPKVSPMPGGYRLLIDLSSSANTFTLPPLLWPEARFSLPIPNDPQLCGVKLYTQAVHIGGAPGLALSNAQDLTLGK